MKCTVIKDPIGNIEKVLVPGTEVESQLYKDILELPQVNGNSLIALQNYEALIHEDSHANKLFGGTKFSDDNGEYRIVYPVNDPTHPLVEAMERLKIEGGQAYSLNNDEGTAPVVVPAKGIVDYVDDNLSQYTNGFYDGALFPEGIVLEDPTEVSDVLTVYDDALTISDTIRSFDTLGALMAKYEKENFVPGFEDRPEIQKDVVDTLFQLATIRIQKGRASNLGDALRILKDDFGRGKKQVHREILSQWKPFVKKIYELAATFDDKNQVDISSIDDMSLDEIDDLGGKLVSLDFDDMLGARFDSRKSASGDLRKFLYFIPEMKYVPSPDGRKGSWQPVLSPYLQKARLATFDSRHNDLIQVLAGTEATREAFEEVLTKNFHQRPWFEALVRRINEGEDSDSRWREFIRIYTTYKADPRMISFSSEKGPRSFDVDTQGIKVTTLQRWKTQLYMNLQPEVSDSGATLIDLETVKEIRAKFLDLASHPYGGIRRSIQSIPGIREKGYVFRQGTAADKETRILLENARISQTSFESALEALNYNWDLTESERAELYQLFYMEVGTVWELLRKIGITLTNRMKNDFEKGHIHFRGFLINAEEHAARYEGKAVPELESNFNAQFSDDADGIFYQIFYNLNPNLDKNNIDREYYSPLDSNDNIFRLLDLIPKYQTIDSPLTVVDPEGKSMQMNQLPKKLTDQIGILVKEIQSKGLHTLARRLLTVPYNNTIQSRGIGGSMSYLGMVAKPSENDVEIYSGGKEIIEGNKSFGNGSRAAVFQEVFRIRNYTGITSEKGSKPGKISSPRELLRAATGLFQNNGRRDKSDSSVEIPEYLWLVPTKSQMHAITSVKENIKLNFSDMKEGDEFLEFRLSPQTLGIYFDRVVVSEWQNINALWNTEGQDNDALMFYWTPTLNKDVLPEIYKKDGSLKDIMGFVDGPKSELVKDVVFKAVEKHLIQESMAQYSAFLDNGIFEKDYKGNYTNSFLNKPGGLANVEGALNLTDLDPQERILRMMTYFSADFAINGLIHMHNMSQVSSGQPHQFYAGKEGMTIRQRYSATWDTYMKRLAKEVAPGTAKDSPRRMFFVGMKSVKSDSVLTGTGELGKYEENFKGTDASDSIAYMSVLGFINDRQSEGRLSDKDAASILNRYFQSPDKAKHRLTHEEIELIEPTLIKNVYSHRRISENGLEVKEMYYKMAEMGLFPDITGGTSERDKLRNSIEAAEQKMSLELGEEVVIHVISEGAAKSKDLPMLEFLNKDGTFNEVDPQLIIDSVVEGDTKGMRTQSEHVVKKEWGVNMGTQETVLLLQGVISQARKDGNIDKAKYFEDLRDQHDKLVSRMIRHNFEKVKKSITRADGETIDLEKLSKKLKRQADRYGWDKSSLEVITQGLNQKFVRPISFNNRQGPIWNYLSSLFNKEVNKPKLFGRSIPIAPEHGIIGNTLIAGVPTWDRSKGLKPQTKDSPGEMIAPWPFGKKSWDALTSVNEKTGEVTLNLSKMDPELRDAMTFRMPTSGHNLMSSVRIVGFFAPGIDQCIPSQDLIAQMGQDFDFDKLFIYNFHYKWDKAKGRLQVYSWSKYGNKAYNQYKNWATQQLDDLLFDLVEEHRDNGALDLDSFPILKQHLEGEYIVEIDSVEGLREEIVDALGEEFFAKEPMSKEEYYKKFYRQKDLANETLKVKLEILQDEDVLERMRDKLSYGYLEKMSEELNLLREERDLELLKAAEEDPNLNIFKEMRKMGRVAPSAGSYGWMLQRYLEAQGANAAIGYYANLTRLVALMEHHSEINLTDRFPPVVFGKKSGRAYTQSSLSDYFDVRGLPKDRHISYRLQAGLDFEGTRFLDKFNMHQVLLPMFGAGDVLGYGREVTLLASQDILVPFIRELSNARDLFADRYSSTIFDDTAQNLVRSLNITPETIARFGKDLEKIEENYEESISGYPLTESEMMWAIEQGPRGDRYHPDTNITYEEVQIFTLLKVRQLNNIGEKFTPLLKAIEVYNKGGGLNPLEWREKAKQVANIRDLLDYISAADLLLGEFFSGDASYESRSHKIGEGMNFAPGNNVLGNSTMYVLQKGLVELFIGQGLSLEGSAMHEAWENAYALAVGKDDQNLRPEERSFLFKEMKKLLMSTTKTGLFHKSIKNTRERLAKGPKELKISNREEFVFEKNDGKSWAAEGIDVVNEVEAIEEGLRTAMTVPTDSKVFSHYASLQEGDIIHFLKKDGTKVSVRVTDTFRKILPETNAEEWSLEEGYSPEMLKVYQDNTTEDVQYYQLKFEHVPSKDLDRYRGVGYQLLYFQKHYPDNAFLKNLIAMAPESAKQGFPEILVKNSTRSDKDSEDKRISYALHKLIRNNKDGYRKDDVGNYIYQPSTKEFVLSLYQYMHAINGGIPGYGTMEKLFNDMVFVDTPVFKYRREIDGNDLNTLKLQNDRMELGEVNPYVLQMLQHYPERSLSAEKAYDQGYVVDVEHAIGKDDKPIGALSFTMLVDHPNSTEQEPIPKNYLLQGVILGESETLTYTLPPILSIPNPNAPKGRYLYKAVHVNEAGNTPGTIHSIRYEVIGTLGKPNGSSTPLPFSEYNLDSSGETITESSIPINHTSLTGSLVTREGIVKRGPAVPHNSVSDRINSTFKQEDLIGILKGIAEDTETPTHFKNLAKLFSKVESLKSIDYKFSGERTLPQGVLGAYNVRKNSIRMDRVDDLGEDLPFVSLASTLIHETSHGITAPDLQAFLRNDEKTMATWSDRRRKAVKAIVETVQKLREDILADSPATVNAEFKSSELLRYDELMAKSYRKEKLTPQELSDRSKYRKKYYPFVLKGSHVNVAEIIPSILGMDMEVIDALNKIPITRDKGWLTNLFEKIKEFILSLLPEGVKVVEGSTLESLLYDTHVLIKEHELNSSSPMLNKKIIYPGVIRDRSNPFELALIQKFSLLGGNVMFLNTENYQKPTSAQSNTFEKDPSRMTFSEEGYKKAAEEDIARIAKGEDPRLFNGDPEVMIDTAAFMDGDKQILGESRVKERMRVMSVAMADEVFLAGTFRNGPAGRVVSGEVGNATHYAITLRKTVFFYDVNPNNPGWYEYVDAKWVPYSGVPPITSPNMYLQTAGLSHLPEGQQAFLDLLEKGPTSDNRSDNVSYEIQKGKITYKVPDKTAVRRIPNDARTSDRGIWDIQKAYKLTTYKHIRSTGLVVEGVPYYKEMTFEKARDLANKMRKDPALVGYRVLMDQSEKSPSKTVIRIKPIEELYDIAKGSSVQGEDSDYVVVLSRLRSLVKDSVQIMDRAKARQDYKTLSSQQEHLAQLHNHIRILENKKNIESLFAAAIQPRTRNQTPGTLVYWKERLDKADTDDNYRFHPSEINYMYQLSGMWLQLIQAEGQEGKSLFVDPKTETDSALYQRYMRDIQPAAQYIRDKVGKHRDDALREVYSRKLLSKVTKEDRELYGLTKDTVLEMVDDLGLLESWFLHTGRNSRAIMYLFHQIKSEANAKGDYIHSVNRDQIYDATDDFRKSDFYKEHGDLGFIDYDYAVDAQGNFKLDKNGEKIKEYKGGLLDVRSDRYQQSMENIWKTLASAGDFKKHVGSYRRMHAYNHVISIEGLFQESSSGEMIYNPNQNYLNLFETTLDSAYAKWDLGGGAGRNTIGKIDRLKEAAESYNKKLAAAEQMFAEKETIHEQAVARKVWMMQNSPFEYSRRVFEPTQNNGMYGANYINNSAHEFFDILIPKAEHHNKKFFPILKDQDAWEYYSFITHFRADLRKNIPPSIRMSLKPGELKEMERDVHEWIAAEGYYGGIKTFLKEAFKEVISEKSKDPIAYVEADFSDAPTARGRIKGNLRPSDLKSDRERKAVATVQSFDLQKLLTMESAVLTAVEIKSQVADALEMITQKAHSKDFSAIRRTASGQVAYTSEGTGDSKVTKKGKELPKNIRDQLVYEMQLFHGNRRRKKYIPIKIPWTKWTFMKEREKALAKSLDEEIEYLNGEIDKLTEEQDKELAKGNTEEYLVLGEEVVDLESMIAKYEDQKEGLERVATFEGAMKLGIWFTQVRGMWLGLTGAFTNRIFGNMSAYFHAKEGFYEKEDYWKADKIVRGFVYGEGVFSKHANKIRALMARFNVLKDITDVNYQTRYSPREKKGFINTLKSYAFNAHEFTKRAEFVIHARIMLATMFSKKVVDKNGNVRPLYEAFTDSGDWNHKEFDIVQPDGSTWDPLVEDNEYINYAVHLNNAVIRTQGNYDPNSMPRIKEYWWGMAIMQFRGWVPETIIARLNPRSGYDHATGKDLRGKYYRAAGYTPGQQYGYISLIKQTTINTLLTMMNSVAPKGGRMSDAIQRKLPPDVEDNALFASKEIAFYGSIQLALWMARYIVYKFWDDEKEIPWIVKWALNTLGRLPEAITYSVNSKSVFGLTLPAIAGTFYDGAALINELISSGEHAIGAALDQKTKIKNYYTRFESGVNKDESKLLHRTAKFLPGGAQIKSLISSFRQDYEKRKLLPNTGRR